MDSNEDGINDDDFKRWLLEGVNGKPSEMKRQVDTAWYLEHIGDVNARDSDGNTPLHVAARCEDTEAVELLVKNSANVNITNNIGNTPLHEIMKCEDALDIYIKYGPSLKCSIETTLIIGLLLSSGADVNVVNKAGNTPLHLAVTYLATPTVEMLLKRTSDLSITDRFGETLLHLAVTRGNADLVELLLKHGADKKAANRANDMPLHIAAYYGTLSVIDVLLHSRVEVNIINKNGDTPLHLAILRYEKRINRISTVERLLKYNADVSIATKRGSTALHLAAHFGDETLVAMLIKCRANVKTKDNTGNTPLHVAASSGSGPIIELLIKAGAEVNVTNEDGYTPLHCAAVRLENDTVDLLLKHGADVSIANRRGETPLHSAEHLGVVERLLKNGAIADTKDSNGNTPLQAAVHRGNVSKVNQLLKYTADVKIANNAGNTVLHTAAASKSSVITKKLLSSGADVNVNNKDGDTPLHLATRSKRDSIVKLLLENNADISIKNNHDNTPFHEAVFHEEAPTVELMLQFGANVNSVNNTGNTPLHIAARRKHSQITDLLLQQGADATLRNLGMDTPLTVARVFNYEDYEEVVSLLENAESLARENVPPNQEQSESLPSRPESPIEDLQKNTKTGFKYLKRAGTSGAGGQLYETKLLCLVLIRALNDDQIEHFLLGTNIDGIGNMDDICLRWRVRGYDRPVILFVQAKHRENPEKGKLTLEDLWSTFGDFSFRKYIESYLMIRERFQDDNENPMFEGDFNDVDCHFVVYTPVKDCFSKKKTNAITSEKVHRVLGTGKKTDVFQFDPDEDDIDYFTEITAIERLKKFGVAFLKLIMSETYKSDVTMENKLIKKHHVVMGREVLQQCKIQQNNKEYRIWKFRPELFDSECEYLLALKKTFITELSTKLCDASEITDEDTENFKLVLQNPCASTISKIIGKMVTYNVKSKRLKILDIPASEGKMKNKEFRTLNKIIIPENIINDAVQIKLMELDIKLPLAFGNLDMTFDESNDNVQSGIKVLSERLMNLLEANKQTKIIDINDDFMGSDKKRDMSLYDAIGRAVGNLLVKDRNTKMLKFDLNNKTLPYNAAELLKELKNTRYKPINEELSSYRIKINIDGFPKDSFHGDEYDKKLATDFLGKYWFYTKQAKEDQVEQILKNHINTYYNYEKKANKFLFDIHCNAIFLKSHNLIQKWWMEKGEASYLSRASDVFACAKLASANNLLLTVIDYMHNFNISCMDFKVNQRINQNKTNYIAVPEAFNKIFGKLFDFFDNHNRTISISLENKNDIVHLLQTAESLIKDSVLTNSSGTCNRFQKSIPNVIPHNDSQSNAKPMFKYLKRSGSSGMSGQLYETKFLSLIKIRALINHNDQIDHFLLGTDIQGIGDMNDICLRFRVKGQDRPVVLFVQTKHRENPEKGQLTEEDMRSNFGNFCLRKYLDSFLMIKDRFQADNEDPMFEGDLCDVELNLIIYTPVKDCFNKKNTKRKLRKQVHYLLNTGQQADVFQYDYDEDDIDYFTRMTVIEQLKKLAKIFLELIMTEKDKSDIILLNKGIARHHVVMGREVLQQCCVNTKQENEKYRNWEFRPEFFESKCEYLSALKSTFTRVLSTKRCDKSKITDEDRENFKLVLRDPCASTISKIIGKVVTYSDNRKRLQFEEAFKKKITTDEFKILQEQLNKIVIHEDIIIEAVRMKLRTLKIKLPKAFGNVDMTFRGSDAKVRKRIEELAIYINKLFKSSNIIDINDDNVGPGKDIKRNMIDINGGIGSAVGNLLVKDTDTMMLKFDLENKQLPEHAAKFLKELEDAIHNSGDKDLSKYRIRINIEGFPKHSFKGDEYDKKLTREFLSELWFYTNQAKEDEVEQILSDEIDKYYNNEINLNRNKTNFITLSIHEEVQKWWMTCGSPYLSQASGLFERVELADIDNLLLTVINYMYIFGVYSFDINVKQRVEDHFKFIPMHQTFNKISCRLFNIFDSDFNEAIDIELPIEVINIHGKFDFSCDLVFRLEIHPEMEWVALKFYAQWAVTHGGVSYFLIAKAGPGRGCRCAKDGFILRRHFLGTPHNFIEGGKDPLDPALELGWEYRDRIKL